MNTLTITVLLVCATMAYAAVLPGELDGHVIMTLPEAVAPAEELLEGAETADARRGYHGGYHGGHHGGHYGGHHGGHHGGYHGHHHGYHGHRQHGYWHGK